MSSQRKKEKRGLCATYKLLKKHNKSSKTKFKILKKVKLCANAELCEIDHILLNEYGIFVFETKSWEGTVDNCGYEKPKNVAQNLGRTYWLRRNPVAQNERHAKILSNVFKKRDVHFTNGEIQAFAVFSENNFVGKLEDAVNISELDSALYAMEERPIFTKSDVKKYAKIIKKARSRKKLDKGIVKYEKYPSAYGNIPADTPIYVYYEANDLL